MTETFSFIPKHLAYMMQDKTERYWYLYIHKNEVAIVTETEKGFYIYDYSKLNNIYAGNSMLTLAKKNKRIIQFIQIMFHMKQISV